jgi:hypothetical protein
MVDTMDSKSIVRKDVGVQVPPWAPLSITHWKEALEWERALGSACGAARLDSLELGHLQQGRHSE